MLSKFRSRDEEQFPPRKKIAPVFKGMEIVVGIFHGHSNIFLGQTTLYMGQLNNEIDLWAVSRITCAKYSA